MAGQCDASTQAFFLPGPGTPPMQCSSHGGDGFTAEEVHDTLQPKSLEQWHPMIEYHDSEIHDLDSGPQAVTFMGRIANVLDVANSSKSPRSAKGCVKLCVKDGDSAITVRLWYNAHLPPLRLGALISLWTTHVSNGKMGLLSSANAPFFTSLFPERDRNCHIMIHGHSDDACLYKTPLCFREGVPLKNLVTLQNFIDGGYDVVDVKVLVVVKDIGARKKVTRKDQSTAEHIAIKIQDHTAEATLGLWGSAALSPFANSDGQICGNDEAPAAGQGWKAGDTILLIQAPSWKMGRSTYLTLASSTIVDVNPTLPDADWLRKWSRRRKSREAVNPTFPDSLFDLRPAEHGRIRCLFTIADLDEFVRVAPTATFQGYFSLLLTELRLVELWKRQMLLSGECCNIALYANSMTIPCKGCGRDISLRLNPRIVGQAIDETGTVGRGKLLFSDTAWNDLLGRRPQELLRLDHGQLRYLSDRLSLCRLTFIFGWTGDESTAGGRICILGVRS